MTKKHLPSRGFTIVELLIYMALLTIFLLVLLDIFTTTLNFKLQSEASSVLNQDARAILANFNYNIYNAGSATVPLTSQLSLDSGAKIYQLSNGDLLLRTQKLIVLILQKLLKPSKFQLPWSLLYNPKEDQKLKP